MKTLGWPPTYVARCPVTLFEAARGIRSWHTGGTVGELHMRPLGGAAIHFQLNDLLDGQVLFEHTMRRPNAFSVPVDRFFVIRQENGSFRGFGFRDKAAANEMQERVERVVRPFTIGSSSALDTTGKNQESTSLASAGKLSTTGSCKKAEVLRCESIPRRSSRRTKLPKKDPDQSISQQPLAESATFERPSQMSHGPGKWKRFVKGLRYLSQLFVLKEHEMEIGYPTDVKHVAHIGWDGPSVNGQSWMDELKPAPDFSSAPLSDFGQPRDPSWIHDAVSAAKWTSHDTSGAPDLPPDPPLEFMNFSEIDSKVGKSKGSYFKSKPRASCKQHNY
uniref:CRIB domain-containing protein n=1 Tax=Araucaria cunninghamii TaxID=56994 RepID=A0A0D6R6S2_ARACU